MFIQGTLDEANNVVIPSKPMVWVDAGGGGGGGGAGSGSGHVTNAQLTAIVGTAAQTAVTTDPSAADQTMLALLRGILTEMQTQTALLEDIKLNTTPGP